MKQIIISLLILSQQAVFAQVKPEFIQPDTLLLVRQSRINYCLNKIEEVNVLDQRMVVKDTEIKLLNTRIQNKYDEISSYKKDQEASNKQLQADASWIDLKTSEVTQTRTEVKVLKKKVFTLKVVVVALLALTVYSWVHP